MTATLPDRPPGGYQKALALAADALAAQKAVTPQQKAVQVAAAAGERVIAVRQSATEFAIQRIGTLWETVNPYDRRQVDEFAAAATRILAVAQVATGTAASAAIVTQLKAMGVTVRTAPVLPVDVRGQAVTISSRGAVSVERETTTVDYDGASVQVPAEDMTTEAVMHRPAAVYRRAVVEEAGDASALSLLRIGQIVDEQLMLTQRLAETAVMTKAVSLDAKGPKVLGYRRLIHPEMSRGGTCGLCIAAADRIYHAKKLRPIHALCKCTISPVTADHDPADELNQADLTQLYKDAGGTSVAALKRTRYKVDEHGELGAVLVPKRPYTPRDKAKRAGAVRNAPAVAGRPETKAQIAARHVPAMEKNLADMRARGVPEEDPKIIWHKQKIAEMRADVQRGRSGSAGGGKATRPRSDSRRPPEARRPATQAGSGGGGSIPPHRFLPGGMDVPEEYPELPDGSRLRFTPRDAPLPTRGDMRRVLRKHRHDSEHLNKTRFPSTWSDADIETAIELTMRAPDPGTVRRRGDKVVFERVVEGVRVRVHVRDDFEAPVFWSAYPPRA